VALEAADLSDEGAYVGIVFYDEDAVLAAGRD